MFGCKVHDGKLFGEHTDEEKIEDGYVQVKPGKWVPARGPRDAGGLLIREFDSGVVPDAHAQEYADAWRALGKEYEDGVGPVCRNNQELQDWGQISGIRPKGSVEYRRVPRKDAYGRDRKLTQPVAVDMGSQQVWGQMIREEDELKVDSRAFEAEERHRERVRIHREKRRQDVKRIFLM